MKKFILILMVLISQNIPAQHTANIFDEQRVAEESEREDEEKLCAPGMPGCPSGDEDLPIDEQVPLLLLIAAGLIVYTATRRKGHLSKII